MAFVNIEGIIEHGLQEVTVFAIIVMDVCLYLWADVFLVDYDAHEINKEANQLLFVMCAYLDVIEANLPDIHF